MILSLYKNNQTKIMFIMIALAIVGGIYLPAIFDNLTFISDIFINLVRVAILPIMFASLVMTFAYIENIAKFKKVIFVSISYILLTEILAVSIAIAVFNYIHFPASKDMALLLQATNSNITGSNWTVHQIVSYLFPDNLLRAFVNFDVLPILILAILLGLACGHDRQKSHNFTSFIMSVRDVFLILIKGIMYLAPLAIFALVGQAVAASYTKGVLASNLLLLLKFVGLFLLALCLHFLWQIALMLYFNRHLKLQELLQVSLPMAISAFITSSSLATLPIALELAKKLKAKNEVVDFMLPICASMNFASGMMYEMAACLFFMHVLGVDMSLSQQIFLGVMCIITGISVGGIPETGMISVITIFTIAHIPLSAIVILMPLDRILDRVRTVVNISGNTCGCLTVSKLVK